MSVDVLRVPAPYRVKGGGREGEGVCEGGRVGDAQVGAEPVQHDRAGRGGLACRFGLGYGFRRHDYAAMVLVLWCCGVSCPDSRIGWGYQKENDACARISLAGSTVSTNHDVIYRL